MDRSVSMKKFQLVPQAEWIPPALKAADIFKVHPFQLKTKRPIGKTEVNLRIEDEGVQTCMLPLFSDAEFKAMEKEYQLIEYGCFRISLSPLFRLGMNCSAYVALIDNRYIKSKEGKIGSFVCLLHKGPVCVDIFPNYPVSLSDYKMSWKLVIAVKGLDRKLEASYLSVKVSCVFRLFNNFGSSVRYGRPMVETKFGSTESDIQELRILEFVDTTDDEPNKDVYKSSYLQQMRPIPGSWSIRSIFKPVVLALKEKCLTLKLVQPSNYVRVVKPGEHSETTEEQESQTRELATPSFSSFSQIEVTDVSKFDACICE